MDKLALLASLLLFACGGSVPAEVSVTDQLAVRPAGSIYRLPGKPAAAGVLLYLQLGAGGRFAWTRCSDAGCTDPVREDGTWLITPRSIRFYQQGRKGDPGPHLHSTYAYRMKGGKLWLRTEGGAAGFVMEKVAEAALCASSGGAWNSTGCDCKKGWPLAYSPGAGGCWQSPAVSEAACDATQGSWTDDDADFAGTYCECGLGRRLTAGGCVDERP